MSLEFRVRWQREGRQPTYRIYQSWNAACGKVTSVQAMDAVKNDTERFADMPPLVAPPELQVREVGEWRAHDYQPKLTDAHVERMKEHLYYQYGDGCPLPTRAENSGEFPF